MSSTRIPASDVPPGSVTGSGDYAVGNNGEYFAVGRKCRHLRADLAGGSIDANGCLVCPWHQAAYDVKTGQMTRGPQGAFAKIPGLDAFYLALTKRWPLRRGTVTTDGDDLQID
ncbi:nitrite reductase/ring-hydroxylating ferredoxin subunit [Humibacillus xanthopallidus]|uniref:Nitrite reductase/ring-hydroxylating ferredoxin subunit n=1 Tax=Humibacillus xanthopallidus TaxID=412689 RepID=A0A543PRM5_9MICO|nr:Rieske 2Fe-2S domain-containing protein [Humibacillus xanthopallidus]TQN46727.1 nitrite reductase/ring-hydroxylating ferredoxin subunit [Humibacillus xanthopallidus]